MRPARERAGSCSCIVLALAVAACGSGDSHRTAAAKAVSDTTATALPVLARVDHLFATAPNSEALFNFFRDTFELPVAWRYKRYGDFASGGLSVGNTVLEFVTWTVPKGELLPTEWKSVAFEPVGDTRAAVAALAQRRISHEPPEVNRYKDSTGKEVVGWTNTDLTGLSPSGTVFICDYADRAGVAHDHAAGREELVRRHGGRLGVVELKEVVIGVTDLAKAQDEWRRMLASPGSDSAGLFTFGSGPRIRLVQAARGSMQEIVIRVHSLARARAFLAGRRLLEPATDGRIAIAARAIGGLNVTLVDE